MHELLSTLEQWISHSFHFSLAMVTNTWGSSPRQVGAIMAVREDGMMCGSVSGGCIEGAVVEAAMESLKSGACRELHFDRVTEDSIWDVGLSCGGEVQVWVFPNPHLQAPDDWVRLRSSILLERPCVSIWDLGAGLSGIREFGNALDAEDPTSYSGVSKEYEQGGKRLFALHHRPKERLIVIGSVHIAIPLISFARQLGFETVVIDPRTAYANTARYLQPPDRMILEWPRKALQEIALTQETYVAVLTHDPKFDDEALAIVLRHPVAYVGALGGRVTQAKRRETLREAGLSEQQLDRIHGPIGLNIGAKTPEEIALSIIAEIVQVRRSKAHAGISKS